MCDNDSKCQQVYNSPKKMKKIENHVQFFSHFRYNRGVGANRSLEDGAWRLLFSGRGYAATD